MRAASRYGLFAVSFLLIALVGPAALAVAALRPAAEGLPGPAGAFEPLAVPVLGLVTAFAVALLFELVLDVVRLRRIKRGATPLGYAGVRNARIGVSARVPTPTAIGYLHPAIVVPADFRDRVDAAEWDVVVAHECAHLARGDDWGKALQSAVLRAGWWMPGLWLLSRRLDLERELASDERAVAGTGARRFAACLLRLATTGCHDAAAPGLWGRKSHVAIRVERLLRPAVHTSPVLRATALGSFSAVAVAVVCVAFAVVPAIGRHSPQATRPLMRHVVALVAPPSAAENGTAKLAYLGGAPEPAAQPAPPPVAAHAPVAATIAHAALPPAVPKAVRRPLPRTPALADVAIRSTSLEALKGTVVAYLPRFRCPTCFHPLRESDGSASASASTASPAPLAAPVALAAEDTGSGLATGSMGFFTLRLPRALTLP